MMFRLIDKYEKIRGFKSYKLQSIFGDVNGHLYVNKDKISDDVDTVSASLKIHNNFLFFDKNNISYMYDFDRKILHQIGDVRAYIESLENDSFICTYGSIFSNGKYHWNTGLYDFKEKKLHKEFQELRNISIIYFLAEKKVIVYPKTNELACFSLEIEEYLWQTDLSNRKYLDVWQEEKEAKIQRIIGVYQNQLIVAFSHEELISIDTETGKILWETKDFVKNNLPDWRNQSQFRFVYWHIENGKMYQLDGNIYYSIDLYTQAVEILWKDEREDNYLTIIHKTYTSDYIYFTGSYNHRLQPHLIGVFNRNTLTVDWVKDMNFNVDSQLGYPPSLNQAPQVDGDKLYVLDTGHTLHIFEKTKDN